jgi:hypothetical protein
VRPKGALFLAALVGAVALTAISAAGARADVSAPLTHLTSFHQIVVDDAAGYVFLSEGINSPLLDGDGATDSTAIVVTDLSGNYVKTLDAGDGVEGLALSPDGTTLYAALAGVDKIGVIDAASLTQTTTYALPSTVALPYSLAEESGKLWVSYDDPWVGTTLGAGAIGDFDLSAASPAFETQSAMGGWDWAPDIASDPRDSGLLVAASYLLPLTVATYNVSTDPATQLLKAPSLNTCIEYGLAVFPGGSQFMVCGIMYDSTTMNLEPGPQGTGSTAYAISPDGSLEAIGGNIFLTDVTRGPLNELRGIGLVAPGGIAFSADGTKLYAVVVTSETDFSESYALEVLDNPATDRSTLTLSAPSTVLVGHDYTLTGSLALGFGTLPAGTPVTITRTGAGTPAAQFPVTTDANGDFALADNQALPGTYTYTAAYAGSAAAGGDAATAATTGTAAVIVSLPVPALSLTSTASSIGYGGTVKVTARLGATDTNRTVSIYAKQAGSTTKTLLTSGPVNASGDLAVSYTPAHTTVFTASFSGDAGDTAITTTHAVSVAAKVSMVTSGYFASQKIQGISYRVYHHTAHLNTAVTVAPNKSGQCVRLALQRYDTTKKAWLSYKSTGCFALGKSSKITPYLTLLTSAGARYRVRADYTRSAADTTNINIDGSWLYFKVVK